MKRIISLVLLASLVSTAAFAGNSVNNPPATGGGGGGAPTTATYVTQTPDATLTNEQALSALSTGPMFSTTATGVVTTLTTLTGLTSTSSALTVNLSTGVSGGQTLVGGTAASNSLTISSTSNGTKGTVIFGSTAGLVFDEVSDIIRDGSGATGVTGDWVQYRNANTGNGIRIDNVNAGTAAYSYLQLANSATGSTNGTIGFFMYGSGSTVGGTIAPAKSAQLQLFGGTGNLDISIAQASGKLSFGTGAAGATRAYITATGSFVHGDGATAISTSATGGFVYVPAGAGAPSGVPVTETGTVPLYIDSTNHKLYMYIGGWLGGTSPGAFL